MKRELTLTDIAGYLPYGLKTLQCNIEKAATVFEMHYHPIKGDQRVICGINNIFELSEIAPVLRPMSDLYVEITERGYNEGKPFVPIVELANLLGSPEVYQWELHSDGRCAFSPEAMDYFRWLEEEKSFIHSLSSGNSSTGYFICNQHEMYDLLHRLHFDYRGLIDAGLAVSVHDLKQNPYEAANN